MANPFPTPDLRQFKIPKDVLVQELNGEAVLLHVGTGKYFGLDKSGFAILQAILEGESIDTAFETILGLYEVNRERLGTDFFGLIDQLIANGLLEEVR